MITVAEKVFMGLVCFAINQAKSLYNDDSGMSIAAGAAIGAVFGVIVVGAMLTIGLSINAGISDSVTIDENSSYYNASQSVITGTTAAYGMSGSLQLVLMAGAVLFVLMSSLGGAGYASISQRR
ncbi:hypothetical protein MsAg5_13120 [Methanosarcinaceae archaeon Ag5]|uniref:Uncharacterized protein n=1 Tax=Methanolapillus africanus TaxID=3028297 RepID=A0AAE4MKU3_9EURY|nr:hypothetical protein [Methanosarcinaceae archaeon Ag5]